MRHLPLKVCVGTQSADTIEVAVDMRRKVLASEAAEHGDTDTLCAGFLDEA